MANKYRQQLYDIAWSVRRRGMEARGLAHLLRHDSREDPPEEADDVNEGISSLLDEMLGKPFAVVLGDEDEPSQGTNSGLDEESED
ncbi:MAG: hypothetical protein JST16_13540 [Bdellovibrionales bacterium]|nr:hypothetical protein [Bdellovibrionales bacterium]